MPAHLRNDRLHGPGHRIQRRDWRAIAFGQQQRRCRGCERKVGQRHAITDQVPPAAGDPAVDVIEDEF